MILLVVLIVEFKVIGSFVNVVGFIPSMTFMSVQRVRSVFA